MPQSLLIIDDAPEIHPLIAVHLREERLAMHSAYDAANGLALARQLKPDLVLLDVDLDGVSGLDVCRQLKAEPETANIAVVMLTGSADVPTKVAAFDLGAVDYVTKPFDAVELRARVRAALRTKRYLDLLATRAQLDGLTGLWGRAHFDQRLDEEVRASRRTGRPLGLLMVDVDHFKRINDGYGHPFGDQVLRQVAETLAATARSTDVVCRYGGEEFGIICRETGRDGVRFAAERLRAALAALAPVSRGQPVRITASFGAASSDLLPADPAPTPLQLVRAADEALYRAKAEGRNRVCVAG